MGEVEEVDLEARQVVLSDGRRLEYDFLIVATGATHAYFGHPEWEAMAPGSAILADANEVPERVA